jgi:L-lactate dehydrogenase complex protein LldG
MLRRVRSAIEPTPSAVPVPRAYRQGSELDPQAVVECFAGRVDDYRATVTQAGPTSLPSRLAELLANAEHVGVPAGPPRAGSVTATRDGSLTTDALDLLEALVTGCALAIAETGTHHPRRIAVQGRRALTLVPDHHVRVVPEDRIVGSVPEGLAELQPTRPITMISGPSATQRHRTRPRRRRPPAHDASTSDVLATERATSLRWSE